MTIGVGVVGTGFVANMHLAALRKLSDVRLVGVADVDATRAQAAVLGIPGARWTDSVESLLDLEDLDACIVCTPNDTHLHIGLTIAAAGKHLLMEKPLATRVEDANALVRAFQGLVLMGAHTHRFYDYGRTIQATIREGAIGAPVYVRLAVLGGWIWPDWRAWVLDPRRAACGAWSPRRARPRGDTRRAQGGRGATRGRAATRAIRRSDVVKLVSFMFDGAVRHGVLRDESVVDVGPGDLLSLIESVQSMAFSAEHARLELSEPRAGPRIGDKFEFVVGYTDTTTMLHDELYATRNRVVYVVWPILGRGKLR